MSSGEKFPVGACKKEPNYKHLFSLFPVNIVSFQALGKTDVIYSFASSAVKLHELMRYLVLS